MEKLVLSQNKIRSIKKGLLEGLTIASGSKSSATYYHSRDEQTHAIKLSVQNLYGISKELPLIIANQNGVTGKFISEVLLNEFQCTFDGGACNIVNPVDWYDNRIGDKAILNALHKLNENGIPYVLRLFVEMKVEKVNNERARKIMLGFLLGHSNLEFNSLKYRNKISNILKHIYGVKMTSILLTIAEDFVSSKGVYKNTTSRYIATDNFLKYINLSDMVAFKTLLFILKKDNGVKFLKSETPVLYQYQKARKDITVVDKVPEEVLIGLISNKKHPQYNQMWSNNEQRNDTKATLRKNTKATSVNQQVRQTKSSTKLGVQKNIKLNKITDFLALYKTGYEAGWTAELKDAVNDLAERKKINNFHYNSIGIIVDKSNSMSGHKSESKNTPKAIADFTARVLTKSTDNHVVVCTDGETTDLASSFVKLLQREVAGKEYQAIFILSDGYENSYDGLMSEVLSIYFKETDKNFPVFQVSPITCAEMGSNVRKLGPNVVTMAVNNPSAIQPQISARLLEIDTSRWLENQISALDNSNVTRNKNNVNV